MKGQKTNKSRHNSVVLAKRDDGRREPSQAIVIGRRMPKSELDKRSGAVEGTPHDTVTTPRGATGLAEPVQ